MTTPHMTTHKKTGFALLTSLLAAGLLGGCGGSQKPSAETAASLQHGWVKRFLLNWTESVGVRSSPRSPRLNVLLKPIS